MQRWIWTLLENEVNLLNVALLTYTADVSVMCCLIVLFYNDTKVWSFLFRSLVFNWTYIITCIHYTYIQNAANKIKKQSQQQL